MFNQVAGKAAHSARMPSFSSPDEKAILEKAIPVVPLKRVLQSARQSPMQLQMDSDFPSKTSHRYADGATQFKDLHAGAMLAAGNQAESKECAEHKSAPHLPSPPTCRFIPGRYFGVDSRWRLHEREGRESYWEHDSVLACNFFREQSKVPASVSQAQSSVIFSKDWHAAAEMDALPAHQRPAGHVVSTVPIAKVGKLFNLDVQIDTSEISPSERYFLKHAYNAMWDVKLQHLIKGAANQLFDIVATNGQSHRLGQSARSDASIASRAMALAYSAGYCDEFAKITGGILRAAGIPSTVGGIYQLMLDANGVLSIHPLHAYTLVADVVMADAWPVLPFPVLSRSQAGFDYFAATFQEYLPNSLYPSQVNADNLRSGLAAKAMVDELSFPVDSGDILKESHFTLSAKEQHGKEGRAHAWIFDQIIGTVPIAHAGFDRIPMQYYEYLEANIAAVNQVKEKYAAQNFFFNRCVSASSTSFWNSGLLS
ncbi:hypothetical protein RGU70_05845 [Herbaspirillum sp. RTI4]|uniref:hypothetical protein n=1 Tax=Herbaspirillum sp. RTI4 TaxID=3048640 RepID=UPI002AB55A8B|nr:hypothetical protein [Herbaspirillum sp. RTI4]MDY7577841.1 hypothetical protein [Herbaspirillum sp. RTI4]MEA9982459.1 hypothetical protein [Herbaspirillum sp. RTI4]